MAEGGRFSDWCDETEIQHDTEQIKENCLIRNQKIVCNLWNFWQHGVRMAIKYKIATNTQQILFYSPTPMHSAGYK